MTGRLTTVFETAKKEGRGCLAPYLVAGHPDLATSEALIAAAIEGGADLVEIGIPWSDPAADGPIIQAATTRALQAGCTVAEVLVMTARLRARFPDTPLVAMTYANIAYKMGWDRFAAALHEHGFDGCILPDVSVEESVPVRNALVEADVAWIPLVAPTTPEARMHDIAQTATGFLYVVSSVGITGQSDPGPLVEATVHRARSAGAHVPLLVGFGIRSAEDVRRVLEAGADGAIVGSHLVAMVHDGIGPDGLRAAVERLREGAR